MDLESFDAVFYTLGFLVPGFIWSAVLSVMVPRRSQAEQGRFLECLTLSCLNNGLWSWLLFVIFKAKLVETHPYWSGLALAGIMLVSPLFLGALSAWLQQKEWIARFLARLGFRTVHPAPTAWDWHFSRAKPYWAMVTLRDGSEAYGLFGRQSFAGDDPENRDLFLEAQFKLLDTGDWAPVEDTAGILIVGDQIATIEFRKLEEMNYGE